MSAQLANNEVHRAFLLTSSGRYIAGASVALDAMKLAKESRSKHAKAIIERAHQHVTTILVRLEKAGVNDADSIATANRLIEEANNEAGDS